MALVQVVSDALQVVTHRRRVVQWTLTTEDPTGADYVVPGWADRSVHVYGTFGGATVVIEGRDDLDVSPGSPEILLDPWEKPLSFTDKALRQILDHTVIIRPRLSVVGAGASISVYLFAFGRE